MANIEEEEGWHTLKDGTRLYTKIWKASGATRAKVVFVHGFSDHCNAYYTLFPTLASRGIQVLSFDQRGWGRSVTRPSQKGLTGPTSLVLSDISSILSTQIPSSVPLFLMGHSMGGAEVLTYVALGPAHIRAHITGYLAQAPLIALHPSTAPSKLIVMVGRLGAMLLPNYQMVNKLEPKWLSRDPEVNRAFVDDELCHDTGTLEGLAGMLDRTADLMSGKVKLEDSRDGKPEGDVRVWVGHGTEDRVTSFEASKRWVDQLKVKDKEFKAYDGWYHKLHAEPGDDKIRFAQDVANWILARSSTPHMETDLGSSTPMPHTAQSEEQSSDSKSKL